MKKLTVLKKECFTSFGELPLMLSVKDITKVLGLSATKTYDLINSKGFPKLQVGKRLIVPKEQFIKWIEQNTL